jgi:hypothetical protein
MRLQAQTTMSELRRGDVLPLRCRLLAHSRCRRVHQYVHPRLQPASRRLDCKDPFKARTMGGVLLPASLFAKPYLKPPLGKGYQRANLVTSDELALVKRVDRQPRAKVESILVTDGAIYSTLYLRLLKKLVRVDTMQYILVMIGDALLGRWER